MNRLFFVVALLLGLTACGGDSGTGPSGEIALSGRYQGTVNRLSFGGTSRMNLVVEVVQSGDQISGTMRTPFNEWTFEGLLSAGEYPLRMVHGDQIDVYAGRPFDGLIRPSLVSSVGYVVGIEGRIDGPDGSPQDEHFYGSYVAVRTE